jgi:hypothetical protein
MAALITAADLGIDTRTDQGLFDWLLASLLFGRPVQQQQAATAYRKFKSDGWDTPGHFTADDQHPLWHELWEGDYHRMSTVMSQELRDVMQGLSDDYDGSVARPTRRSAAAEAARASLPVGRARVADDGRERRDHQRDDRHDDRRDDRVPVDHHPRQHDQHHAHAHQDEVGAFPRPQAKRPRLARRPRPGPVR